MTRPLRRVAVTAVAAVTAVLASDLPLHGFGIVMVVVLAGLDILLLQATGWLTFRRGSALDERQTALRDRAYRRGFRLIGLAVLLLWLVWFVSYVLVAQGATVSAGAGIDSGIAGRVLVVVAELLTMMATCVVAWREDGSPESDGVAAAAGQGLHGRWMAWLLLPVIVAAWLLAVAWGPPQSVARGSISFSGGGPASGWTCHEFGGGTMIGADFGATVGLRAYVCWNGTDAFVWGDPALPPPASLNHYFKPFTAVEFDSANTLETGCGLDNVSDFAAVRQTTCAERIDAGGTMHYTVSARVAPLPFGIASREVTLDLMVTRNGKVLEGQGFEQP
jgi:hypothetical protein